VTKEEFAKIISKKKSNDVDKVKVNFWLSKELYDLVVAYQICNSKDNFTDSITSIVNERLEKFKKEEIYEAYLEFKDEFRKIRK
jgi:hypothetical protein